MLARTFLYFFLSLGLFNQFSFANDSIIIDDLIQNDREERILNINQQSLELNESMNRLNQFSAELKRAEVKGNTKLSSAIAIRNASAIAASIGFISTLLFESKGINPSNIFLRGGYSISAIAAFISYLEFRAIRLTKGEITKLSESVDDLGKLIKIAKRNLAAEVRLICSGDTASLEACGR